MLLNYAREKIGFFSNLVQDFIMTIHSEFLIQAQERGFLYQSTDLSGLDDLMKKQPITAYLGFDATADSLHVGSLVQIMWLRLLQRTGHKPLVLMGGGTSKIGDPTGKDSARQVLSEQDIANNIKGIGKIFSRFLNFGEGQSDAMMLNNADWLESLNYIDFLRDFGSHFSVNRLLSFDSVKLRLEREQNLSFLEFNYMILQSYDFLELNRRYGCVLELGGSDQWGNIVSGVDLVRKISGKHVYGLTSPLVITAGGQKMGKTASGAVWLNPERLSVYDYWQFWRNTHDQDVGKYLRLFTDLPIDEIKRLEELKDQEINEAKKILADEATTLAHGRECLDEIHQTVAKFFNAEGTAKAELQMLDYSRQELSQGIPVVDLLCRIGFATSKGEARRLIKGGGARLNDTVITDEELTIKEIGTVIKLSAGKKRHIEIKLKPAE